MKALKISLLVVLLGWLPVLGLQAQSGMEDVVYLKNGSVYRGLIVEQVPDESLKIRIMGGSVIAVTLAEVEKITKEQKQGMPVEHKRYEEGHEAFPPFGGRYERGDSAAREFKYRKKGLFMVVNVLFDNKQGGVHLVKGYKFNQHAALGLGVGVDYVFSSPFNEKINDLGSKALAGFYVPFFFHLTGDMFPARVSPFYAVEAGYAIGRLDKDGRDGDDFKYHKPDVHGAYGMLGLGVKLSGRHGRNFSVLFNMNVKQVNYKERVVRYDSNGNPYKTSDSKTAALVIPGVRLGFGLTSSKKPWQAMRKEK